MIRIMKRLFLVLVALACTVQTWGYDFSHTTANGNVIYLSFNSDSTLSVVSPTTYSNRWTGFTEPKGYLVIPDSATFNGRKYAVTEISSYAFHMCRSISVVSLPNTLTRIGGYAFYGCRALYEINFPSSLKFIGTNAFFYNALRMVEIPKNVELIETDAFRSCSSLQTLYWGADSCAAGSAFGSNLNITDVHVTNTCRYILSYTFSSFLGLTNLDLPESLLFIGNSAFNGCSKLKTVVVPRNVTVIGSEVFSYCSSLRSVTLPESLDSLGSYVFRRCTSLDSVFLNPKVPPRHGINIFKDANNKLMCFIPCNSFEAYSATAFPMGWYDRILVEPDYSDVLEINLGVSQPERGTANLVLRHGTYISCDSLVCIEAVPNPTCHFYNWSNGSTNIKDIVRLRGYDIITANFIKIDAVSNNEAQGTVVSRSLSNKVEKITAVPVPGYEFDHWSNGRTCNPDTIRLVDDTTVTAFFKVGRYTVTIENGQPAYGNVSIAGTDSVSKTVYYGETVTVCGSSKKYHHNTYATIIVNDTGQYRIYDHWGEDTANFLFLPTANLRVRVFFAIDTVKINAVSSNPTGGTVSGGGEYECGTMCTITAIPNEGYKFVKWTDGETDSVRTFRALENANFVAIFKIKRPEGIDGADEDGLYAIDALNGSINVVSKDTQPLHVSVYDVGGRVIADIGQTTSPHTTVQVPNTGLYFVRVNDYTPRKIMVVKK